ncbi:histidine--tRNA ligase [Anaerotruncus colihominis]|uniref:histidine--tRNA ligase n=1 Tax=Anaerotruncus colihominis TaxID=169435 RepID=UPI0035141A73
MALLTNAPRGTQDVLPSQSARWRYIEETALDTARLFGFEEIRVPTFEHTELFNRSVGDTTDVVQKEMYTFFDKGDRSITLRPEGTAGVMRAILQNGLTGGPLPVKASYVISCFRYEKPQAGRLREFHQFGVEMAGAASPAADAQVIALAKAVFDALGVTGLALEINSIGCPECRARYHEALRAYFQARAGELCETCRGRLEKNPMRILDCKSPVCAQIAEGAPHVLDYICDGCRAHFEGLKTRLDALGIAYTVNPTIVRGLDYYTRTVFEFVATGIGAQGTVCGGGRYDGLIEMLGGTPTPSIGFAMGLERLLLVMDQQGCAFLEPQQCTMYIGSMGEAASVRAIQLADGLRREGFWAECDTVGRSVKAQMKYADKLGAKFSCILGDNELAAGKATVKRMDSGVQTELKLDADVFTRYVYHNTFEEIAESGPAPELSQK